MTAVRVSVGVAGALLGIAVATFSLSRYPLDSIILVLISFNFFFGMWRHARVEAMDVVSGVLILLATTAFWWSWPIRP